LHSRLAVRRSTQFLDREVADCGLSPAQLGLAQRIGLDQSTLSRNLRTRGRWAGRDRHGRNRSEAADGGGSPKPALGYSKKAMPIWRAALAKIAKYVSLDLACQLAGGAEGLVES